MQPGTHLGPYEIISPIGAGGMGEVYKARDTRLDRTVAIKVLPSHLADKPQLRERFEREARTVASLNHPHICVLHDIGQQDGVHFLVMEYLEGETLAQRLDKGPLPLDQVLRCAIEISDALDKAHRQGVTHRDLKPGNIMLTKAGSKLLDFGLAKLKQQAAPDNIPFSQLPTAKDSLTVEGTILGTLQYMAPEQVEGKVDEVDARTDIFAFGAVVYEMATGKKAFEGSSTASVMSKIMQVDPPPMSSLQPMTPPALDRVVKRCLAKEPDDRWQSARDVCEELKWIKESGLQAVAATVATPMRGWRWALPWAVAVVLSVVVGIGVWILRPSLQPASPPTSRPVTRLVMALPPTQQLAAVNFRAVALSPDGTHLAYVSTRVGNQQLYLRPMNRLEFTPIPGTEGARDPFFSPDGQWVGFFAGGELKKVSVSGGAPLTLCAAPDARGGSWGTDDTIVFAATTASGLSQVSAAGGTPQGITGLDSQKGERSHRWPEFLPGGKAVLFAVRLLGTDSWDDAQIVVQQLETGERRVLVEGGTHAHYVPTGHLVYIRARTLLAVPFDLARLEVTGAPVPIVEGVMESINGTAQFSFSGLGVLVYIPDDPGGAEMALVWVDRQGAVEPLAAPPRNYLIPRLTPDGRRVAVVSGGGGARSFDIWVYDISRDTLTRLTLEASNNWPLWTPDGKRVTFASTRAGPRNLFWKPADSSGPAERLATSEHVQIPMSWSSDGQMLAFVEIHPTTGADIWVLPLEGERKPRPFLQTPFNESAAKFSPDGRWLAYVSDESGQNEIYVQPFAGPGGKLQISTDGGVEHVWAHNGRELFYRNGSQMMAVDITAEPTFNPGNPRLLFRGEYMSAPNPGANYDVTSDGQRFLMIKASEEAPTQINVVLNWFEELKQRVPVN